jgi:hypothetical protein
MQFSGSCIDIIGIRGTKPIYCGQAAIGERLACLAGRRDAVAGPYCECHGGRRRAEEEASHDWLYVAPESVGGEGEVLEAGAMGLGHSEAYLVIREERGRILVWIGIGSRAEQLRPAVPAPSTARHRRAGRHGQRPTGAMVFFSRDDAIREGTATWRSRVTARIAEIYAARGGTLGWGVPVEPLAEPVIIDLGDAADAWAAAKRRPRIGRLAMTMLSGVRPTGEVV